LNTLENFIYGDTPERESVSGLVNDMIVTDPETHAARTQGEDIAVSLYSLSAQHDIRPLVLRTLMTYFEMDGYIEETTPIYSNYQFKPLMSSAKILENFEGERREFLLNVFKQSKKAKTWFSIDLDRTAKNLSCDRQRLVRALDYLAEQQMLELKPSGLIHRFRITKLPENPAEVIDALCEKMQRRERRDLERLGEVVDLMIEPGCQVSRLGAYFGEPLEKGCGHCSRCESQSAPAEVPRTSATIDDNLWRQATAVRSTNTALSSPVLFARFVCGISSPKLTKARLGRHELNGVFGNVPFQTILDRIRQETGQDVDLPF
jgi:ATP-dependent DNA helicase RecQ